MVTRYHNNPMQYPEIPENFEIKHMGEVDVLAEMLSDVRQAARPKQIPLDYYRYSAN